MPERSLPQLCPGITWAMKVSLTWPDQRGMKKCIACDSMLSWRHNVRFFGCILLRRGESHGAHAPNEFNVPHEPNTDSLETHHRYLKKAHTTLHFPANVNLCSLLTRSVDVADWTTWGCRTTVFSSATSCGTTPAVTPCHSHTPDRQILLAIHI